VTRRLRTSAPGPADRRRVVAPPGTEAGVPGHGELVLIVEDEAEFRELLELWISRHGWRTATASDGLEVVRRFEQEPPDLVLLDLNLPGMSGWEVTRWIRVRSTVPILMVTAMGGEADVVQGLESGADDYLTKPVRMAELVARVAAALRRVQLAAPRPADDDVIEHPGLRIEQTARRVVGDNGEIHLTPTELRLLVALASRSGEPVGHAELLRGVWGPTYGDETQLLRVTMRNLRSKLAQASPGRTFIVTEYGVGYRFKPTP
jgi:two-component system, OmpR family, KDP operon response regulator KdpE